MTFGCVLCSRLLDSCLFLRIFFTSISNLRLQKLTPASTSSHPCPQPAFLPVFPTSVMVPRQRLRDHPQFLLLPPHSLSSPSANTSQLCALSLCPACALCPRSSPNWTTPVVLTGVPLPPLPHGPAAQTARPGSRSRARFSPPPSPFPLSSPTAPLPPSPLLSPSLPASSRPSHRVLPHASSCARQ